MAMDTAKLQPALPTTRARGQLREGFRYVARTPDLLVPLVMMGLVGMLAYEFQVTLPVAAQRVFHGGAETFGIMTAAMGIGAVIGGLVTATRGKTGMRALIAGLDRLRLRASPSRRWHRCSSSSSSPSSSWATPASPSCPWATRPCSWPPSPQMRGRVMALWSVAFLGTTPIGGPLIGWVTAEAGARVGLAVGALSCFAAGAIGLVAVRRHRLRGLVLR